MAQTVAEIAQEAHKRMLAAQAAQGEQVTNPIGGELTWAQYGQVNKKKVAVGGRTLMPRVQGEVSDGGIFDLEKGIAPRGLLTAELALHGEDGPAHLSALMNMMLHFSVSPEEAPPPELIEAFGAIPCRFEGWASNEDVRSYNSSKGTATASADSNDDIPA